MRTQLIFNNVNANTAASVDIVLPCEKNPQDLRFLLQATKTLTDGNPRIIIEESIEGTVWTQLEDTETWNPYTEITETIGIKDNYFMGKYMRVRLDPNGTTTGTVWAIIGYKTKV
jgi:hypothetical protein